MKHYFVGNEWDDIDFEEDVIIAYRPLMNGRCDYYLCPAFQFEYYDYDGLKLIITNTINGAREYIEHPDWWSYAKDVCDFYNLEGK